MVRKIREAYHTDDPVRHSKQMRNMLFSLLIVIAGALTPMIWSYFAKINKHDLELKLQQKDLEGYKDDLKSIIDALGKQAEINASTRGDIQSLQQDVMYYKDELGEIKRIVLKTRGPKDVSSSKY